MDKDYRLPKATDPEFAGPVLDATLEKRRLARSVRLAYARLMASNDVPEFVFPDAP